MDNLMEKYRSRKWRLTLMILFVAVAFAGVGLLTSELSNILMGLGASYNGFQGLIDWQKAKNNTT